MLNTALETLPTPALILDEGRMVRNVQRLRDHLHPLGVSIRPHLKTIKSVDGARRILEGGHGPATVSTLNQEHGIVVSRDGPSAALPCLPIGTRLRILPNHACATGSQHEGYHVLPVGQPDTLTYWPRFRGW